MLENKGVSAYCGENNDEGSRIIGKTRLLGWISII